MDPGLHDCQESGQKEIELHEDDPVVMMALFCYIYDSPYRDLYPQVNEFLQFLAKVCVRGEYYQIQGLHANVAEIMEHFLWNSTSYCLRNLFKPFVTDFLGAVQILFAGRTAQDKTGRPELIEFCLVHIRQLKELPAFLELLREFGDLGVEMFARKSLGLLLDESWRCNGEEHMHAVPRCPDCGEESAASDLRKLRDKKRWDCPDCEKKVRPVCSEHSGADRKVTWEWE